MVEILAFLENIEIRGDLKNRKERKPELRVEKTLLNKNGKQ